MVGYVKPSNTKRSKIECHDFSFIISLQPFLDQLPRLEMGAKLSEEREQRLEQLRVERLKLEELKEELQGQRKAL